MKHLFAPRARQLAFVFLLLAYVLLGIHTQIVTLARVNFPRFMEDYEIFNKAQHRAAAGLDPYENRQTGEQFLYPPPSFFVFGIFALIPSTELRGAVFILTNLAALAAMLVWLGARYAYSARQIWWWFPLAFGFAPLLELLYVGQINLLTGFGIVAMFVFAETFSAAAGLALWMAVVTKLTPIAYLAYLAASRHWRAFGWTALFLLLSFVASTVVYGADTLAKFLQVFTSLQSTFYGEYDSQALVPILVSRGWLQHGAWLQAQSALNDYGLALCLVSGFIAWRSRVVEPFFILLGLATTIVPSNLWYNRHVLLLLPILVWIAWSKLDWRVSAWCLAGLFVMQVDRQPFGQGLFIHLFVHASLIAILAWQIAEMARAHKLVARLSLAGFSAAIIMIVLFPIQDAMALNSNIGQVDDWIRATLPAGSRIAYDATFLPVKESAFDSEVFPTLVSHSPDWYEQNGFEYLVFGGAAFEAAARDPVSSAKQYAPFFDRFRLRAAFQNGSHRIEVFQSNPVQLPVHRQTGRFGLFSEWFDFVGYDLDFPRAEFFFRVVESRREAVTMTVRLLDRSGQLLDQVSTELLADDERWQQKIVSRSVKFPLEHPVGVYKIETSLEGRTSGNIPLLSSSNEYLSDNLTISPVKVPPAPATAAELNSATLADSMFGRDIRLLRYSIEPPASPSGGVGVRLYWVCENRPDRDYTVFVHLIDSRGKLVAQTDSAPIGGAYPTSSWGVGEMVPDRVQVILPSDLPKGEYQAQVGLYDSNLARLQVKDQSGQSVGDALTLGSILIK